ncbi:MAG TPA: phosphate ABC transporter ATP-binding protein [Actinospica sp.]|nr:phosphate ABC transporter ATP-binding protein [Actinospica sp.]
MTGSAPGDVRPALESVELSLGFGAVTVLRSVSLRIERGGVFALLGPTGSGKSTFLRSLNRMNDKIPGFRREGQVLLEGESVYGQRGDLMDLRRRVGMLFQRPNPFPMSIAANVVAGVRAHKMAPRRELNAIAQRRLEQVGLWDAVKDRLGESPFRLSGGQQQLLCLARALAVEPEVLLLDEPTSSLDPVSTEAIEALIRSLAPELTVVIVTHNLGQAKRVADHTAFFHDGHLVEHGPTEQLFGSPAEAETARYIAGALG